MDRGGIAESVVADDNASFFEYESKYICYWYIIFQLEKPSDGEMIMKNRGQTGGYRFVTRFHCAFFVLSCNNNGRKD